MNLRLYTGVWGKYIDTFERACAASLAWPQNKAAIKGANWNIVTEEKYFERVNEIRARCGVIRGANIKLHSGQDPTQQFSGHLYEEMAACIREEATFLFCLPDYVFGDGTVANLKNCMTEKGLWLAVPNTRVLPSTMDVFNEPRTNAELVTIAFDKGFMHQTWRDAEIGKPTIDSYYGGVAWVDIGNGLIAVTHRLPSSYLCQFLPSDIEYFKKQLSFSAWDHQFPSELIEQGRQRYVGSSDVAFITEITEADKNCAIVTPVSPRGPTDFFRSLPHHKLNRNVMTIFRKSTHGQ